MRRVPNRKRPQKMGGSRMHHGRTSDVHDHANAALSNPILLWRVRKRKGLADTSCTTVGPQKARGELSAFVRVQTQNKKIRAEALLELETSCADPVDQHLSDIALAVQGEDCVVTQVVVNHEQEVPLVTLSTDAGRALHVHVKRLQRGLCRRKLGGVRGSPQPPLDTGDAGRARPRRKGREGPGKTRDKDTGGHALETKQGGVTKAVVSQESLVRQEDVGARTSTPTPLTCSVPLTELLRGGDVPSALLLLLRLARTTTGAGPLRSATPTFSTSSATASSTAATSATSAPTATAAAASASTTATDTSTPATTPTATPTPSAASTAASTAPASSSSAPAPFALARAASPARGRRRTDRLKTNKVGRTSKGDIGQKGGGGTPLKDGGARVTTRGSYSDYALLCC
ncbi:unnamed protein product [Closterium sp. NIES-64]|nr:unnamed protein product [Closterium sp. NIES-64]